MVNQNSLMFAPGNPANNQFWNSSLPTIDGYPILQQISFMNNGLLDKIEDTPGIILLDNPKGHGIVSLMPEGYPVPPDIR